MIDSGQRARQDSNLQPSDSKSPGLSIRISGSVDLTVHPAHPVPSGAANPGAIPAPGSYGADEPLGSRIRGAMRRLVAAATAVRAAKPPGR